MVRAFLRFLSINGITEGDLSALVPRSKRPTTIPATYSEEEIHRFEIAIDRSNAIGKRDYAMLLLATRLGMRSGDIAKLSLMSWISTTIKSASYSKRLRQVTSPDVARSQVSTDRLY